MADEDDKGLFDMDFLMMILLFSFLPQLMQGLIPGQQEPSVYNIHVTTGGGADEDIYHNPSSPPGTAPDGWTWNWEENLGYWVLYQVSGDFR
jgi:hypothetical protein